MLHVLVLLPSPVVSRPRAPCYSTLACLPYEALSLYPLPFTHLSHCPIASQAPWTRSRSHIHTPTTPLHHTPATHQQTHYCNLFPLFHVLSPLQPQPWSRPSIAVITSWLYRTPGPILHSLTLPLLARATTTLPLRSHVPDPTCPRNERA